MRIAALLLLAVGCSACDRDQPATPTAATPPPTTTTAPPVGAMPPLPRGAYALRGTVTERAAQIERPIANANVNVWVQTTNIGYSYWYASGPQMTDADGRYELVNLPADATIYFDAWKDGYVQQCATPPLAVGSDLSLNAQLVSQANVSASPGSVPPSAPGYRLVSGVVYELADSRHAVSNAFVDYEPIEDFPAAVTRTDAQGRFLLCGIPQDRQATIGAALGSGRVAYYTVPPGGDATIDIEIK